MAIKKLHYQVLAMRLVAVLLAVAGAVQHSLAEEIWPPAKAIFNGHDLSGWVVDGAQTYRDGETDTPIWTARDGMLQSSGQGFGFLRYDKQLCDFELQLEVRLSAQCNTGIGLRHGKYTGEHKTRPSRNGIEIQLTGDGNQTPGKKSTGSLYLHVPPKSVPLKPLGEWNAVVIRCQGPRVQVTMNGELIQDVDQRKVKSIADKPLCGYISLQSHGGDSAFRNVRLTEMTRARRE
jgi:hypothetical protein